jgi:hypothetical protein
VRFDPLPDLKGDTPRDWLRTAVDPEAHLVTDASANLGSAGAEVASDGPIVVSPRQSREIAAFRWVNTVISNLKTAIWGNLPPHQSPSIPRPLPRRGAISSQPAL